MPQRRANAPGERVHSSQAVDAHLRAHLPRWSRDGDCIQRRYRTAGWKASVLAVGAVAHLAEAAWHHPELIVGYDHVVVRLSTHSAGGVTDKDYELAERIEQLRQRAEQLRELRQQLANRFELALPGAEALAAAA